MKKIVAFIGLLSITFFAICQNKDNIQTRIPDYNEKDTIKLDDLLSRKDIFICNKNYPVLSFVLVYKYGNNDYMMISKSNYLTEDMKTRLVKFKSMNIAFLNLSFKAITVRTPQMEEIKTGPLKYILKIK